MDPLRLLSSENPDPHRSQSPSPGTAHLVKELGSFPEQPREQATVETTLLPPTCSVLQDAFSPQDTFKAHHLGNRTGHEGTQANSESKL